MPDYDNKAKLSISNLQKYSEGLAETFQYIEAVDEELKEEAEEIEQDIGKLQRKIKEEAGLKDSELPR